MFFVCHNFLDLGFLVQYKGMGKNVNMEHSQNIQLMELMKLRDKLKEREQRVRNLLEVVSEAWSVALLLDQ